MNQAANQKPGWPGYRTRDLSVKEAVQYALGNYRNRSRHCRIVATKLSQTSHSMHYRQVKSICNSHFTWQVFYVKLTYHGHWAKNSPSTFLSLKLLIMGSYEEYTIGRVFHSASSSLSFFPRLHGYQGNRGTSWPFARTWTFPDRSSVHSDTELKKNT